MEKKLLTLMIFFFLFGFHFQNYFGDPWNCFDFFIVLGSLIDIVFEQINVCIFLFFLCYFDFDFDFVFFQSNKPNKQTKTKFSHMNQKAKQLYGQHFYVYFV